MASIAVPESLPEISQPIWHQR